ncbi:MAG: PaaI family thioesterase [Deltaproteobacteria bacterium]|nr:PaaI family thioesterase [Deltaproteobacteria bacterium]
MTRATAETESRVEADRESRVAASNAVRRLISHLRKTKAPRELLQSVADESNALADRLASHDHPGPYAQHGLVVRFEEMDSVTGDLAEFFPYSPIIGPMNPVAPPVEFRLEGEELHAEHRFDVPYNGPPTGVHGGVVAMVFDELLGCLAALLGVGGFTGTLTIRYRALTPLGQPIRMRSWLDRREGRKAFIHGTMHDGATLCAEAEGIFIRPTTSFVDAALAENAER